jgi:HPt (histidine-containing phosphotransfer) domain-containing protein
MSDKLLDYREALDRLGGDEEFLKELLAELITQVDDNLDGLREAVRSKNYSNLKTLSHSLKGASANLNVTRMAEHLFELENLGASLSVEGAEYYIDQVKADRNELADFLKTGI